MTTNDRRSVEEYLGDIVTWASRCERHLGNATRGAFLLDEKTIDACTKCAEAIGEAANQILRLDPELAAQHPGLRLAEAYKSRNRLSHGYHSIDTDILWSTVSVSIPATRRAAEEALRARINLEADESIASEESTPPVSFKP